MFYIVAPIVPSRKRLFRVLASDNKLALNEEKCIAPQRCNALTCSLVGLLREKGGDSIQMDYQATMEKDARSYTIPPERGRFRLPKHQELS
jgi:hypothetical protein